MKKFFCSLLLAGITWTTYAGSTVSPTNALAYGANIGWCNWRPDAVNGVAIDPFLCHGYIYCANVGWIHLGNGTPPNGKYANTSGSNGTTPRASQKKQADRNTARILGCAKNLAETINRSAAVAPAASNTAYAGAE